MINWPSLAFAIGVLVVFFQSLVWLQNKIIAPRQQQKIWLKQNVSPLLFCGLTRAIATDGLPAMDKPGTIVGLIGEVDGFAVEISTNFQTGLFVFPFYLIRVYFNADGLNKELLQLRCKNNLSLSSYFRWGNATLTLTHADYEGTSGYTGTYMNSQVMLHEIEKIVFELKALNLKPVTYAEGIIQRQTFQD
ncbi:hypothetical protein [Hymenobacter baengnokdamensis]|uniref:hypothetical protein n=1 Tax=Hymenobacter baengnokdamensis TaxID=2615203 RepID=UPI0012459BC5|nr:hypothetical protein [Hymenobacter baengnokdamensis]